MFTRCIKSFTSEYLDSYFLPGRCCCLVAAGYITVPELRWVPSAILSVLGTGILITQLIGANLGNVLLYREEREKESFSYILKIHSDNPLPLQGKNPKLRNSFLPC